MTSIVQAIARKSYDNVEALRTRFLPTNIARTPKEKQLTDDNCYLLSAKLNRHLCPEVSKNSQMKSGT